jgi:hypothetical protein
MFFIQTGINICLCDCSFILLPAVFFWPNFKSSKAFESGAEPAKKNDLPAKVSIAGATSGKP